MASQEMYDTARKIEDNLEMYWCLSRNDKKVTDFRHETQCVEDAGIYLVLVSFATGLHGPFLLSTENSHILSHTFSHTVTATASCHSPLIDFPTDAAVRATSNT